MLKHTAIPAAPAAYSIRSLLVLLLLLLLLAHEAPIALSITATSFQDGMCHPFHFCKAADAWTSAYYAGRRLKAGAV